MARDIDYAAIAVKKAIVEKFGRKAALDDLAVTAKEKTILVRDGDRAGEGSRDRLLAGVREADTYLELWERLPPAQD